jgi:hypothetical protein
VNADVGLGALVAHHLPSCMVYSEKLSLKPIRES